LQWSNCRIVGLQYNAYPLSQSVEVHLGVYSMWTCGVVCSLAVQIMQYQKIARLDGPVLMPDLKLSKDTR
jgi:hypothetical protein